jgi:hypothetical protein
MRFFKQPSAAYRNFQIVFSILTLNFVVPALSYTFAPEAAVDSFVRLNEWLGGAAFTFPEAGSRLWRYLGAANVMTLGLMCFLLQLNVRRFFPVLLPLTFMKTYAALAWLGGFFADTGARVFLAAAILDLVTSVCFVFFAARARRDIANRADDVLVPRPRFGAAK